MGNSELRWIPARRYLPRKRLSRSSSGNLVHVHMVNSQVPGYPGTEILLTGLYPGMCIHEYRRLSEKVVPAIFVWKFGNTEEHTMIISGYASVCTPVPGYFFFGSRPNSRVDTEVPGSPRVGGWTGAFPKKIFLGWRVTRCPTR